MPKIQWLDLPPQLRKHLFDRAKEPQINMQEVREMTRAERKQGEQAGREVSLAFGEPGILAAHH